MDEPAPSPGASRPLPSRNEFDEEGYLWLHPDVAGAIDAGIVGSAWQHFTLHGFGEGRRWVPKPDRLAGVIQDIAPDDEMHRGDTAHYFDAGESALHCIESALFASHRPKSTITAILDLPCGHGRVMRFLKKAFPDAKLTACDLNRSGVEFCAGKFGARPVISHVNPVDIPLREDFDLIWCGSLLTHLPQAKCAAFLNFFLQSLRPGGLLVFTLHGRQCESELVTGKNRCGLDDQQVAQLLGDYRQTGFGYVNYSHQPGYGVSLTGPSFVVANFLQRPEWRLLGYQEAGWDGRQDAICLQKLRQGAAPAR